ncbi:MAG: bifunctional 4-hydroxy-2-oxoglutarate aldolase/2-dehydro-3-deoxy-phosphogluconate aldolase [Spirochaetota bacterium]
MEQNQFESYAGAEGIIPVVTIHDAVHAVSVANALVGAGFHTIEVTLRTPESLKAIQNIARSDSRIVVGAGSVTRESSVDEAIDAGAEFLVSPGLTHSLAERALKRSVAYLPGIATPSEIMTGIEMGLSVFKFFPAEPLGGTEYLKAISAPFPDLRFIPTGGIRPENLGSYLSLPQVLACGGSWLTPRESLASGDMETVTKRSREAKALVSRLSD